MKNLEKEKFRKKDNHTLRTLTTDEQAQFINWLINTPLTECEYKNVYLLLLCMGLRVGEALALSTQDINLKKKELTVNGGIVKNAKGVFEYQRPILQNHIRTLKIPDFLYPYIEEQIHFSNNQKDNNNDILFKSKKGGYIDPSKLNIDLKRILKNKFNITGISTHALRYTFIVNNSLENKKAISKNIEHER